MTYPKQKTEARVSRRWITAMALSLSVVSMPSQADSDHRYVPTLKSYQTECAACHMAYPPGMLGAPAWQRIMGGLSQHFGTDASIDDATVKQIGTWLNAHASRRKDLQSPPEDRITTTPWFVRKHRDFSPQDWTNPKIGSASNCMACHQGADRLGFDEDGVRLPAGVGRSSWWRRDGHD